MKILEGNACSADIYNSICNESDQVSDNVVQENDCGPMTSPCVVYRSAKDFTNESTGKGDGFALCCSTRKVQLPPLFAVPARLQQLYQGNDGKISQLPKRYPKLQFGFAPNTAISDIWDL